MLIDNDNTWVILATPNRGTLLANFYSSENPSESLRPIILLNHTNVTSINLSPSSPTTDADTPVTFSYTALDHLLASVNVPVEWTASNGTISQTGVFTPYSSGQHTISACFGIICSSQVVTVTPGARFCWLQLLKLLLLQPMNISKSTHMSLTKMEILFLDNPSLMFRVTVVWIHRLKVCSIRMQVAPKPFKSHG